MQTKSNFPAVFLKTISCFLFRLALVLGLMASGMAHAQISDVNSAINKAGRMRMLSHRMAKAYFQLGLGVDAEQSRRSLDSSMALFDRQLVELKNYAPTSEIRATYKEVDSAWAGYKSALTGAAPNSVNGKKVLELSEQVVFLANRGTLEFEKYSGKNGARLVNAAGRVRMMSQRMAKLYQAQAWKVGNAETDKNLESTRQEFVATLQELVSAPVNTQQIKDALASAKLQWVFFNNALDQRDMGSSHKLSTDVATTSERILDEMETVVGLYERLAAAN
jgi:nitrate/nitrite-specific signal transduction histidine kinase